MSETLKIVIPMAGWGTRMRPHTWSKPKSLVSVAGKSSFEHLMDMFSTLPAAANVEFIFIFSPHLGEMQIPPFVKKHYPQIKAHFIVQHEMKGQSHALYLTKEHLRGPVLVCFSDTLIETDFSFLATENADSVVWVMPVPDPRRFGVTLVNQEGWVTGFIEKPDTLENNLALVGCYYFKQGKDLVSAIEEQFARNLTMKNEYFLADTISIMIARGAKVRPQKINTWLDTGTIEATLDTNRALLEKGLANTPTQNAQGNTFIPPVFVHPQADVSNSVIGPHASIGADCKISHANISDSIIEEGANITSVTLIRSLIGNRATISADSDTGRPLSLNIGDDSSLIL